jgi:hypothetical protein
MDRPFILSNQQKSQNPCWQRCYYKKNKVVSPKYYDSIVPYIDIDIKGNALYKID